MCTFSATSTIELESHRAQMHPVPGPMKTCTIPGCTCSFKLKRELNDHLVTAHRYFRCLDIKCTRVFKQRSRMESHFAKHGSLIPTRPPQNQEQKTTSQIARSLHLSERVSELAGDTYSYLQSVQDLADNSVTRSEACLKMINDVLEGIAADQRPNFATSLYLRAIQVAMSLPPVPPSIPPASEPLEPPRFSPALSSSIDSGVSTRPDQKPPRKNSLMSDDPKDSDFSGGEQHREKQTGGDLTIPHPQIRRIRKRKREPVLNGSETTHDTGDLPKHKKPHFCAECGLMFWKKRELLVHRGAEHQMKKAVEAQGLVLRISAAEVSRVEATPPPAMVSSYICIEEPCSEVFPSFHELWAHLSSIHYNNQCP